MQKIANNIRAIGCFVLGLQVLMCVFITKICFKGEGRLYALF